MTTAGLGDPQDHLYEAYVSQHVGHYGDGPTGLVFRRDIPPLLPPEGGSVVDLGCGRGQLVQLLPTDGYDAEGMDISPEQTALAHAEGVTRACRGDFCAILAERPARCAAITATDLLEHLRHRIVTQNLTFVARKAVVTVKSADS